MVFLINECHNFLQRFRKINPDRWEFAGQGFEQGKKHLLKHMKRRNISQFVRQKGASESRLDSTKHGVDAELEKLRNDHDMFKAEILKLKQQNEGSTHDIAVVRERLRIAETKQRHMVVFMLRSFKNPKFLQHFIGRMEKRRELSGPIMKKRRLESKKSMGVEELMRASIDEEKNVEVDEELMIESEIQPLFSDEENECETSFGSENFVMWEKMMEDEMIYEEEDDNASEKHLDIVSELENLIAKPVQLVGSLAAST